MLGIPQAYYPFGVGKLVPVLVEFQLALMEAYQQFDLHGLDYKCMEVEVKLPSTTICNLAAHVLTIEQKCLH